MNNYLVKTFIFTIGAVTGSLVTWRICKTKYEQLSLSTDDIQSIKDSIRKEVEEEFEAERRAYEDICDGYTTDEAEEGNFEEMDTIDDIIEEEEEEPMEDTHPYVIPPEEYDTQEYNTMTLSYFADGVLADLDGEIVEDVDGVVGITSLEHFGEYEEDAVYVRNDELLTDIEILRDLREYSEAYSEYDYYH